MADFLAHHLFGQNVFVSEEAVPLIARREDAPVYLWGLQGPDLFYSRKAVTGRPLAFLATRLHDEPPGQFFYSAARFVLAEEGRAREIATAYLAGLLCHYALDRVVHPYVRHFEAALAPLYPELDATARHYQIETDLDTDLYALWRKAPVSRFRPWDTLRLDGLQWDVLGRMLGTLVAETCHFALDPQEVGRAFDDALSIARLCYGGGRPAWLAARGAELFTAGRGRLSGHVKSGRPRWDSLNLGKRPWTDSLGAARTDSVPELLAQAETDARLLMKEYGAMLAAGEVKYKIFEDNYSGRAER